MKKNLLAGLVASLLASAAAAIEPFTVRDIRLEGIQRVEAGTVFSYLPVKVGDTMTDEMAAQAIRALFATGFFKDVRIEMDGGVVVVVVGATVVLVAGSATLARVPSDASSPVLGPPPQATPRSTATRQAVAARTRGALTPSVCGPAGPRTRAKGHDAAPIPEEGGVSVGWRGR